MEITLLYASLLTILAVFLAFKAGSTRGKTNTMLGYGDSRITPIHQSAWKFN
jgi:hypothetical protein